MIFTMQKSKIMSHQLEVYWQYQGNSIPWKLDSKELLYGPNGLRRMVFNSIKWHEVELEKVKCNGLLDQGRLE